MASWAVRGPSGPTYLDIALHPPHGFVPLVENGDSIKLREFDLDEGAVRFAPLTECEKGVAAEEDVVVHRAEELISGVVVHERGIGVRADKVDVFLGKLLTEKASLVNVFYDSSSAGGGVGSGDEDESVVARRF